MKQRKIMLLLAVFTLLMTLGGVFAYFTSTDQSTNTWTTGNITIKLQEPEYDKIPQTKRENITPAQNLTKDPLIKNTGSNDAFVFLQVSIPKADIRTTSSDGALQPSAMQELFSYAISPDWTKVEERTTDPDQNTYTYCYGCPSTCTPLAPGSATPPLFQNSRIRFKNIVEGQTFQNKKLEIPIQAFGIQTSDLGMDNTALPAEVWDILMNQTGSSAVSD